MAYLSLYRKYRSQGFDDILGQQHITRTLVNALSAGRVGHAYLFTGPRGTGKTSTARVLAKALNCLASDEPTPAPCGVCEACVRIRDGFSLDVTEIDAASNRTIDDIRALRDSVAYTPAQERMKVYVIDEVHQLTIDSFNALLKTLEEPPAHVVFILATTELHKVPTTILSRCQRFDFRRADLKDLRERITSVADAEGWEITPEAVTAIAFGANGGYRDALGILEQVAAFTGGAPIGLDAVNTTLGGVPDARLLDLVDALASGDAAACFRIVDDVLTSGVEVRQFLTGLRRRMRDHLMIAVGAEAEEAAVPPEHRDRFLHQSRAVPVPDLLWFMERLDEAERDLRFTSQHRLLLETTLVRLAARARQDPSSLPVSDTFDQCAPRMVPRSTPPPAAASSAPDGEVEWDVYVAAWSTFMRGLRGQATALLAQSRPVRLERGALVICVPDAFRCAKVNEKRENLEVTFARALGHRIRLRFESGAVAEEIAGPPPARPAPDAPAPQPLEVLAPDVFQGRLLGDDPDPSESG